MLGQKARERSMLKKSASLRMLSKLIVGGIISRPLRRKSRSGRKGSQLLGKPKIRIDDGNGLRESRIHGKPIRIIKGNKNNQNLWENGKHGREKGERYRSMK